MDYRVVHSYVNFVDYRNEIIEVLSDPDSTIFVDTNMLSQMFKLRRAARQEFYAWVNSNLTRIHLPHWAYNEYMKRAVDPNKLKEFYPVRLGTVSRSLMSRGNT